jgi:hypothetical protein
VENLQGAETVLQTAAGEFLFNFVGEISEAAAVGGDFDFAEALSKSAHFNGAL